MPQLPDQFYTMPQHATTTMTTKDLKAILLATDGWILACGYMWDIKNENLGAGVKRVFLKQRS